MQSLAVDKSQTTDLRTLFHGSKSETPYLRLNKTQRYPALEKDLETDVIVIGAGVAGLTTALLLLKKGKRVAILESKIVGSGNSASHPGDLSVWKRLRYSGVLSTYDKEKAALVADSHIAALQHVEKTASEENINCGFQHLQGYVFTDDKTDAQMELSAAKDASISGLDLVDDVSLGEKNGRLAHVLQLSDAAKIDPVKYLDGLAEAVTKAGGQIFEDTRVRQPGSETCLTMRGNTATAREAVVLATGVPITKELFDSSASALAVHGKETVRRRYAVALDLPQGSAKEGIFYEMKFPPRSAIVSNGQLIATGEEHDQGMPAEQYGDFYNRLEAWVRQLWPSAGTKTHQWSYQVFETSEGLSFHGKDPAPVPGKDVYISYGDCGETLTAATIGGLIVSDEILGRQNKFSDLYSPSRKLLGPPGLPPLSLRYLGNTIQAVAKQVIPRVSNPDIEDIQPGQGAIVQKGVRKAAVFRDAMGQTHTYSAVCPHLGCLVEWNPAESQWNCPCHGSCFDRNGGNMGGPSTLDLEPLDSPF